MFHGIAHGNIACCISPVSSGIPIIRFMFCSAWPLAPCTAHPRSLCGIGHKVASSDIAVGHRNEVSSASNDAPMRMSGCDQQAAVSAVN